METKQRKSQEGAALIIAIIVMMIMILLSSALLVLAYSVFQTSSKKYQQMQAREMAVSITEEIATELTSVRFQSYEEQITARDNNEDSLWFYLRYNLFQSNWPYYNPDEPGHSKRYAYRYFKLNNLDSNGSDDWEKAIDDVSIKMYWESEAGASRNDTPLIISVTCTKGEQISTITSTYQLSVSEEEADAYKEMKDNGGTLNDLEKLYANSSINPKGNQIYQYEKWEWGEPIIE